MAAIASEEVTCLDLVENPDDPPLAIAVPVRADDIPVAAPEPLRWSVARCAHRDVASESPRARDDIALLDDAGSDARRRWTSPLDAAEERRRFRGGHPPRRRSASL